MTATHDPPPAPSRFSVAAVTDRGRVRARNEDAFLVLHPGAGQAGSGLLLDSAADRSASGRGAIGAVGPFLFVADGLGGPPGGDVASRTAVSAVTEVLRAEASRGPDAPDASAAGAADPLATILRKALEEANRAVHRRASSDPRLGGMGTTGTLAAVAGGEVRVAQVGDSRAYLVRGTRARPLTRDQTVAQRLVERGQLTEAEAERSPQRHILLQALGIEPTTRVILSRHDLRAGDRLLLCSDGLTGVVGDEELGAVVGAPARPDALGSHLETVVSHLVDVANDRGGPDNVTVVLVGFEG